MARYQNPKRILPYRPLVADPDPENPAHWRIGLKDRESGQWLVPLLLYRLPELLAAPHRPVMIPEGEKDVETLRTCGHIATCNPFGAGKWLTAFNHYLRGRDVVILPDNDDAGRRHALSVARSLAGVARSLKIVHLPGLPPGGDVTDWLAEMTAPRKVAS